MFLDYGVKLNLKFYVGKNFFYSLYILKFNDMFYWI